MFSQIKSYFFPRPDNSMIDPNNGSKFQNIYIPDEVLEVLLSHVETRTLLACRRVCKKWQSLIETQVLKIKAQQAGFTHGMDTETKNSTPWMTWYMMLSPTSPFNCNLVKNPCGHNKLGDWSIIASGGDGWKREEGPTGFGGDNSHLPYENKMRNYWQPKEKPEEFCFVTSYGVCAKQQIFSLARTQTMMDILDQFKPVIVYRDWFCRRFDCGGRYKLKVCLLNESKEPVAFQEHATNIEHELNWQKVENKFEDYPPGVRYVLFHHEGVDSQFWRGHYGPKMTQSTVFVLPPGIQYDISMEDNLPLHTTESEANAEHGGYIDFVPDQRHLYEVDHEEVNEHDDGGEEVDEEDDVEELPRALALRVEERVLDLRPRREEEEERREEGERGGEEGREANGWDGIPDDLVPPPFVGRGEAEEEEEREREA
uniref:F-box only protein 6 n=1 Tax=Cacopsylla melanoneura TaxID=428564 RepID=A0A8D9BIF8_9HEMI